MLFLPNGQLPPKKSKSGVARGRGASGHWLRARANVINLNTPPMSQWRAAFGAAKMNWRAMGPTGANNAPTMGIAPQDAWGILAGTYLGILKPGWYQGNIQTQAFLTGCATEEAFQVMVQTTLNALGLPPAPAPPLNSSYLASPTLTANTSLGPYDYILTVPPMPPTDPLTFSVGIGIFINSNTSDTFTPSIPPMPTGVTATLSAPTFTLTYNPISGSSSGGVILTLSLAPYTAPLTASLSIGLASSSSSAALPLALAVTTGNVVPVTPCPLFAYPTGMSASTLYDSGYNVTGFELNYQWLSTGPEPFPNYPCTVSGLWMITASAAYTSSYSAPAASTWSPILASGPLMPLPADVLTAWTDAYGDLPPTGKIKFQAQYVDPATGAPGPTLSCTAEWTEGTLQGADLSGWTGPKFLTVNNSASGDVTAGTTAALQITVQGSGGYGGTITFTVKAKTPVPTGSPNAAYALPPGVIFTVTPATLTIAPGDTTIYTINADAPIPGGIADYLFKAVIEATDGLQTNGGGATTQIIGGSGLPPNTNFLTIDPTNTLTTISIPGTATVDFTLSNTGPDDIFAAMLYTYPNADLSFAFSALSVTVPGGTLGSPGTAAVSVTITVPAVVYNPGTTLQVEASAGVFTTYAAVQITI